MKYDCPKCKRSLNGQGWALWVNWREAGTFTFTCPNCGVRFRINIHRAEWLGAIAFGLVAAGFYTFGYLPSPLQSAVLIIGILGPIVGGLIGLFLHYSLQEKQRYKLDSHAV